MVGIYLKSSFARCITWDTANNVGEISGHAKVIITGDMKKTRPYRIASGGEDFQVNFYEGTPFKFNKINKEHTNYVTGIRFSPDDAHFVSVGFDKKIVIYDGKDGSVKYVLSEDKAEGAHTGAIIGVTWLDNTTIATCSLDKSVKVWDISEKSLKFTLYPREKSQVDIPEIFCGINNNGIYIIAITLNGKLNFWKISDLAEGQAPTISLDGHQNYITSIVYNDETGDVISADNNGKISS